ncbi:MAG TPA: dihydrodipicolinate synthase family protein [Phycisphaerae bacterium]|nr:dihydrodipicolinate synthase family protein [Phycisphaerae bacterium]
MSTKKLSGIFTPNMVPLDDRGRINEPELRRIVDWLIAKGISGLYPNGSTGEFTRFSFEERKQIVRIVAEQTAGRAYVLAGAAEANVGLTLEAASYYHSLGVDAVAIVAPFYYKLSQDGVYAYFAEIARESPIDLTLYNIPQYANPIGLDIIRRLAAEYPRIIGIKDSSRDLPYFLNLMHEVTPLRPDFVFLTGCEEMVLPSLMMGADGGTLATSGVVPEVVMKLYHLARAGRFDEARAIQYKLLDLIKLLIFGADFPEAVRLAVGLRGFRMGVGRQPLSANQKFSLEEVGRVIQCTLSEFGFVNEPPGGCARTTGNASTNCDAAAIERIVTEVVQQLKSRGL